MSKSKYKSISVLGRQPKLGLAELESLYGARHIRSLGSSALLELDVNEINFKRLGGTIKLAKILNILPTTRWSDIYDYLLKTIPEHLKYVPEGSFTFGVSLYGISLELGKLNRDLLSIKKMIRKSGRSARVVPNKSLDLSSAQVLHNKLTSKGAWELLLIRDGRQTILAQTMFVQDIDAYAARDQARPKRDARVGMLPPKLAQIMINLANPLEKSRLLDPFCGSGVVLQEAMLMGFNVLGGDIDVRMVGYAKENLQWLVSKYPDIEAQASIEASDATHATWPKFTAVVSEASLGKPLSELPPKDELDKIINQADEVIYKFLKNLGPQIRKESSVVLAVPAWKKSPGGFIHLPLVDRLSVIGYTLKELKLVRQEDLIYFRPDQTVARQILLLRKK